jgi:hypothetical protein
MQPFRSLRKLIDTFGSILKRRKSVAPLYSPLEIRSARKIQRAWRRRGYFLKHGETILSHWLAVVEAAKGARRRERITYIKNQKKALDIIKKTRAGGALRENWKYLKQPPGGVLAADPFVPLSRQLIWTNHDVALFVAISWSQGKKSTAMQPFFAELCPRYLPADVERMHGVLRAQGAIEDLSFLKHLEDDELDRLLPAWVADDVRKQR